MTIQKHFFIICGACLSLINTSVFAADDFSCNEFTYKQQFETHYIVIRFEDIPADQMKDGGSILGDILNSGDGYTVNIPMKDAVGTIQKVIALDTVDHGGISINTVAAKITIQTKKTPLGHDYKSQENFFSRTEWVFCEQVQRKN